MRFFLSPEIQKSVRETAEEVAKGGYNALQTSNAKCVSTVLAMASTCCRKKRFKAMGVQMFLHWNLSVDIVAN